MDYAQIAFLSPEESSLRVCSHVDLEALIDGIRGKHKQAVGDELRLMFKQYVLRGWFSFSYDVFDHIHGMRARQKLMNILVVCSEVVKKHSQGNATIRRVFRLRGVKKCTTYSSTTTALVVSGDVVVWRTIAADWLTWRYKRWCDYCKKFDIPQRLDIGGVTDWGKATFEALDSVSLPTVSATDHGQAQLDKLTQDGVPRMVKRCRGWRMYNPLTCLPKSDRKHILIDGQPTGECDLHATYIVLLCSLLPPSEQGPILALQWDRKWYDQFQPVYDAWQPLKAAQMRADGATDEEIAERFKGGVKAEFQRQCLFWHDTRDRPLWAVLRGNHRTLSYLIACLHRKFKPEGLSNCLMRAEAAIFVDGAIPELAQMGVKSIGLHDGLLVALDDLPLVRAVLERIAYDHLGFVPRFATRTHQDPVFEVEMGRLKLNQQLRA